MRKTNEQKGITLIALIITIIVLLILAVVAIGAITQDGIINHAKNAKQEYGAAQDNESTLLGNYLDKINANAPQTGNGGAPEEPGPGETPEQPDTPQNPPVETGCDNCNNGYITGYVCSEYGNGCVAVSTEYSSVVYVLECDKCDFTDATTKKQMSCNCGGTCRWDGKSIDRVSLNGCGHGAYGTLPTEGTYPCPVCSGSLCQRCSNDGYIKGYVCSKYGTECNNVSTEYYATYILKCGSCEDTATSSTPRRLVCEKCDKDMVWTGEIEGTPIMAECLHEGESGKVPQEEKYPCPECSK